MIERAFLDLGERLTKALITSDWALYRTLFQVPVRIAPRGGTAYVLETWDDLRHDFELYVKAVATSRITDIVRRVKSVHALDGDQHVVLAQMNILSGATRVVPPFDAAFTLQMLSDGLRLRAIESALGHIRWTIGEGPLTANDLS